MEAENEHEVQPIPWRWKITKRLLLPSDPLFVDGDLFCCMDGVESVVHEDVVEHRVEEFACHLSGCNQVFTSLDSYDAHYHLQHVNRCATCKRSFPSNHLLHIHILESHDSLFLVKAANEDAYECLVESCRLKFPSSVTRRDHLVKVHHYPPGFRFHRNKHKNKSSSSKQGATNQMEVDHHHHLPTVDTPNPATSGKRVFSYKVPPRIAFGHGAPRGFSRPRGGKNARSKHWHQTQGTQDQPSVVNIENVDMTELSAALETGT